MAKGADDLRRLIQMVSHTPEWTVEDHPTQWILRPPHDGSPYAVAKATVATPRHLANIGKELAARGWSYDLAQRALKQARAERLAADRHQNALREQAVAARARELAPPAYTAAVTGNDRYLPPGPHPEHTDLYFATNVLVGPELAEALLRHNLPHNRPVSEWHLMNRLCAAIESGDWLLTHQAIAFDTHHHLVDGQKRLIAIARTGIGVPVNIAYNVAPDSFAVIDTMQPRTPANTLHILDVPNAARMAAAVRTVHLFDEHRDRSWRAPSLTNAQVVAIYRRIGDDLQAANKAIGPLLKPPLVTSAAAIAGFYLARRAWPRGPVVEFVQGLADPRAHDTLPATDPRRRLGDYLRHPDRRHEPRDRRWQLALFLAAYNDFAHGRARKGVSSWLHSDQLPEPVTGPAAYL